MLCCRIHNEGDQRLTWSKNKNEEQNPRRECFLLLIMRMCMFFFVRMLMLVCCAVFMKMLMCMRFVLDCPSQTPDKIHQPKRDQQSSGDLSTHRFNRFKFEHSCADENSDKSKYHRTEHMSQTADKGYKCGFSV